MTRITQYIAEIRSAFSRGDATEHTHRATLKDLIERLKSGITATNEPKRQECGAPDLVVTLGQTPIGYIETKDVCKPLDAEERGEQMSRYLPALGNLILTDYLEFRWYVDGERRLTARLGNVDTHGRIMADAAGEAAVNDLLFNFINTTAPTVGAPKELAERMARLARLIRETTARALTDEDKTGSLHGQFEGFRRILLHDLTEEQFADMYAQTICYGLFAAWCGSAHPLTFTREHAALDLPKTNPFLRKTFQHIAGYELDDRIAWAVDDVANLLAHAQRDRILEDFGKRTRKDPVMHFYETLLAAYDPKLREMRGVYYTPEPIVSYIVRGIDHILKNDFGLPRGLADSSKVSIPTRNGDKSVHKVQILDPAAGTGTFLYGIFDLIHESFVGKQGMWSSYVREHLLPRVFGFELLMAPYTVTHMKLGLQLDQTGYDFASDERLGVYLTNTLEEADRYAGASLFAQWVVEEANAAARVKNDCPIMVVLGNPPYSGHSANRSWRVDDHGKRVPTFIGKLIQDYHEVDGEPLGEKNPKWLQDDYVKFIRFAQWRIERTGHGVLAFITNHGYLDNPTFRGMRRSLMNTFDEIYVLDLHGNSKKKERAPDGSPDKNVFDIQQGVAIGIFVKRADGARDECRVHHAELWGNRDKKYEWLSQNSIPDTEWRCVAPCEPSYGFASRDGQTKAEYERGWFIGSAMPVESVGIVTARDALTLRYTPDDAWRTVVALAALTPDQARDRYKLGADVWDWKVAWAQRDLRESGPNKACLAAILYRPMDVRYTYYTGRSRGFHCRPRNDVMRHMLSGANLGLIGTRQTRDKWGVFTCRSIIGHKSCAAYDINSLFPLYLYPAEANLLDHHAPTDAPGGRRPNLAPEFIADFSAKLGMSFVPDGKGDRVSTFGPEDVFSYMYALFHSPEYRRRYAEFLKIDFPRLPLTGNPVLFRELCALGDRLVSLHLMDSTGSNPPGFPVKGTDTVDEVRYQPPSPHCEKGRVWINSAQYFDGVPPEVWEFHIGGYQVCQKWLKDRKGRMLVYGDLEHYRRTVAALADTIRIMSEVDEVIARRGGFPLS